MHSPSARTTSSATVFSRNRGEELADKLRCGMVAVNSVLAYASVPGLPFGGVGDSGFGRIHGEDGLREFARAKAITVRRARSMLPSTTFERTPAQVKQIVLDRDQIPGESRVETAGQRDTDLRVELVDRPVGFDAPRILRHALATAEPGQAFVTGLRVDPVQSRHRRLDMPWMVSPERGPGRRRLPQRGLPATIRRS